MASAENRHCANCIGTVSFPIRHRSGAKRQCALNPAIADLLRGTHCDEYLIFAHLARHARQQSNRPPSNTASCQNCPGNVNTARLVPGFHLTRHTMRLRSAVAKESSIAKVRISQTLTLTLTLTFAMIDFDYSNIDLDLVLGGRARSASDVPQTRLGGGAIVQLPCTGHPAHSTPAYYGTGTDTGL